MNPFHQGVAWPLCLATVLSTDASKAGGMVYLFSMHQVLPKGSEPNKQLCMGSQSQQQGSVIHRLKAVVLEEWHGVKATLLHIGRHALGWEIVLPPMQQLKLYPLCQQKTEVLQTPKVEFSDLYKLCKLSHFVDCLNLLFALVFIIYCSFASIVWGWRCRAPTESYPAYLLDFWNFSRCLWLTFFQAYLHSCESKRL